MTADDQRQELIRRCRDGEATADEMRLLETHLRDDPAFRLWYVRYMNIDAGVDRAVRSVPVPDHAMRVDRPMLRKGVFLQWRLAIATAAGMIFGIVFAPVGMAIVGPYVAGGVTILEDSFESGPAPLVTGIPTDSNRWGGDFTGIVTAQQGVSPASGTKMLRFLRADYEGKPNSVGSYISDLYRIVDVRPFAQVMASGDAVVDLSAKFNAYAFPDDQRYECSVSIYALTYAMIEDGVLRDATTLPNHALASASRLLTHLDRDPMTWETLDAFMRVPASCEVLVIRISMFQNGAGRKNIAFDGHYLDDVRMTLTHNPSRP